MQTVVERMNAARDLAAEKTKALDLAISPLVASLRVEEYGETGYPAYVSVHQKHRSWYRQFYEPEWGEEFSVEEIAHQLVAWVQGAIDRDMLSVEDLPLKWIDLRG